MFRVPLNESELAEFEAEKLRRLSESVMELETDLEAGSEGLSMELSPSNLTRGLSSTLQGLKVDFDFLSSRRRN